MRDPDRPRPRLEISSQSLDAFRRCPFKYRLQSQAGVRGLWHRPSGEQYLGNVIHGVLRDLYRSGGPSMRDEAWVTRQYRTRWDGSQFKWQDAGFPSREEAVRAYRDGLAMLVDAYREEAARSGRPILIEQEVDWVEGDVRYYGRIDRIDQLAEDELEVIDYKTGVDRRADQPAPAEPLELHPDDAQMGIYAVVVEKRFRPRRLRLTYRYLASRRAVSFESRAPVEERLAMLRQAAGEISATAVFAPRPGPHCRWCDFAPTCPEAPADLMRTGDPKLGWKLRRTAELLPDDRFVRRRLDMFEDET